MPEPTLTLRELNRATLARQMLLAREKSTPVAAIERLAALQAQVARSPFVALWSRTKGFRRKDLASALTGRIVVKATLMRGTLHLMSARDYLELRGALQPALGAGAAAIAGDRMGGVDPDDVLVAAQSFFEEEPRTFAEVFRFLSKRFPGCDERALGYIARLQLPLVQVPSDAPWSFPGSARFALAEPWLGKTIARDAEPDSLVLRYLGALGPATIADIASWTRIRSPRGIVDRQRRKLVTFRNEQGRELFDLPDAPRPPPDTEAPVRFLPEFDNVVLSGADRTRFMTDEQRNMVFRTGNLLTHPSFLVDGRIAGVWATQRRKADAALVIGSFEGLTSEARDELADEGDALLRFMEPDAETFDVRIGRFNDD